MWYVYFLKLRNGHIYVGSTDDLRRRYRAHQHGEVKSTEPARPVELQCYVAVRTRVVARRLERYFKSGSGKAVAVKRFLIEP